MLYDNSTHERVKDISEAMVSADYRPYIFRWFSLVIEKKCVQLSSLNKIQHHSLPFSLLRVSSPRTRMTFGSGVVRLREWIWMCKDVSVCM